MEFTDAGDLLSKDNWVFWIGIELRSDYDAVVGRPPFKKRPTLRGEISLTMPRLTTSVANSDGLQ